MRPGLRNLNYIKLLSPTECMAIEEIIEGIFADTSGTSGGNYGAIALEDEIIMVDAGMIHTKSKEVKRYLEDKTGLPILKLVFTHSHGDHVFGAQAFEPVSLVGSSPMRQVCERNLRQEWKKETLLEQYSQMKEERPEFWEAVQDLDIRLPDIVFDEKIALGNNNEVEVRHMGGHTAGSSIVTFRQKKLAFVGDLIFAGRFPYAGDPTCDPDRWIMALERIRAGNYQYIIPGHGPVCDNQEIDRYIDFLSTLRDSVTKAIDDGLTPDEYLDQGLIHNPFNDETDRFTKTTLDHWFQFYSV